MFYNVEGFLDSYAYFVLQMMYFPMATVTLFLLSALLVSIECSEYVYKTALSKTG